MINPDETNLEMGRGHDNQNGWNVHRVNESLCDQREQDFIALCDSIYLPEMTAIDLSLVPSARPNSPPQGIFYPGRVLVAKVVDSDIDIYAYVQKTDTGQVQIRYIDSNGKIWHTNRSLRNEDERWNLGSTNLVWENWATRLSTPAQLGGKTNWQKRAKVFIKFALIRAHKLDIDLVSNVRSAQNTLSEIKKCLKALKSSEAATRVLNPLSAPSQSSSSQNTGTEDSTSSSVTTTAHSQHPDVLNEGSLKYGDLDQVRFMDQTSQGEKRPASVSGIAPGAKKAKSLQEKIQNHLHALHQVKDIRITLDQLQDMISTTGYQTPAVEGDVSVGDKLRNMQGFVLFAKEQQLSHERKMAKATNSMEMVARSVLREENHSASDDEIKANAKKQVEEMLADDD